MKNHDKPIRIGAYFLVIRLFAEIQCFSYEISPKSSEIKEISTELVKQIFSYPFLSYFHPNCLEMDCVIYPVIYLY